MNFFGKLKVYLPKGSTQRLVLLLVILIGLPLAIFVVQRVVRYKPGAQVATVSFSSTPATATLPPNATVRINLNAGAQQVGFVRAVLTFNRAHINLAGEITTSSRLKQNREPAVDPWVIKTTMAEANSTGRIVLVLALDELDRANPPTGTFEIANFPVRVVSTQSNLSTALNFTVAESQVVNMGTVNLGITASGSTFTLNPVTNTPTNTLTPTNTPTNTPTATNTPTNTPTTAPRPDLQVLSIVGSVGTSPNTFNFRTTVRNNGPAVVPNGTAITLHGGYCNTSGCSVPNASLQLINTRTTGLAVNATYEYTQTVTNLIPGNVTYRANVDYGNTITEVSETNNNLTSSSVVPSPTNTSTLTPTGTPSQTLTPTPGCNYPGDANCDNSVDILDYSILFASFGKGPGDPGYDPRANLNHSADGEVDILDYSVLYYNFGNHL